MESRSAFIHLLKKTEFSPLFQDFTKHSVSSVDLSTDNPELIHTEPAGLDELQAYINKKLEEKNAKYGVGGYLENRIIYQKSELFGSGKEARTVHLGIDIWCEAGTPVFCPYDGKVHSFKMNNNFKDYGPTIILEHQIEDISFYTLYGHLSRSSLSSLFQNKIYKAGELLAETGDSNENGEWPPHLHFQIINDMKGAVGDFPGVISKQEKESFSKNCPDPKLIMKIPD